MSFRSVLGRSKLVYSVRDFPGYGSTYPRVTTVLRLSVSVYLRGVNLRHGRLQVGRRGRPTLLRSMSLSPSKYPCTDTSVCPGVRLVPGCEPNYKKLPRWNVKIKRDSGRSRHRPGRALPFRHLFLLQRSLPTVTTRVRMHPRR